MFTAAGPTERIWWILLIFLVVGYLAGTWLNRQRSKAIGKWLESGIGALGGRPAWRWMGSMSSGAQITVTGTGKPFEQVQITFLLLTREFLPLWGVELLRGKGDLLVIRASLRQEPATEIEIVPLNGSLHRRLDQSASGSSWHWAEGPAGLGLGTQGASGPGLGRTARQFLERYGALMPRLSLRKRQPHLMLFIRLGSLEARPAAEFVDSLQQAIGTLARRQE